MTTKDLLKVFQLEKPKPNQLVRIMWVEEDEGISQLGDGLRTPEEAERFLSYILSFDYYKLLQEAIRVSAAKFPNCKPTTNLRNSYIVEA